MHIFSAMMCVINEKLKVRQVICWLKLLQSRLHANMLRVAAYIGIMYCSICNELKCVIIKLQMMVRMNQPFHTCLH